MVDDHPSEPRCSNCGAAIPWRPVMHRGRIYCCGGCAQGGPCYCSYDLATGDWLLPERAQIGSWTRRATAVAERGRPDREEID
jgi:hypothetical protein